MLKTNLEATLFGGMQVVLNPYVPEGNVLVVQTSDMPKLIAVNLSAYTKLIWRTEENFDVALRKVKEVYLNNLMARIDNIIETFSKK